MDSKATLEGVSRMSLHAAAAQFWSETTAATGPGATRWPREIFNPSRWMAWRDQTGILLARNSFHIARA